MGNDGKIEFGVQAVGNLCPKIRSDLVFCHQSFRSQDWYLAQDPITGQFHRFGPAEYRFLRRLDGRTSVERVVRAVTDELGEETLKISQAFQLLNFLRSAQLLTQTDFSSAAELHRQGNRAQVQKTKKKLQNFLFVSIPLVDPDRALTWLLPYVRCVFGWGFFGVWILTVGFAIVLAVAHRNNLLAPLEGVVAPDQLLFLYLMFLVTKFFHESAHGLTCKLFGGSVHEAGVLFLVFTPCFYVDASSAWRTPNKWPRMFVSAAGMYIEFFLAAWATILWAMTQPGLVHSLAYKIMFLASISTLLFNGNPLLRYDAYYLLADWLEIPNLAQNSNRYLKYLAMRYLIGLQNAPPLGTPSVRVWYVAYGVCSFLYRVVIITSIIWFISSRFFELGLLLGIAAFVTWMVVPAIRLVHLALFSAVTQPHRIRAASVILGSAALVMVGISTLNAPMRLFSRAVVTFDSPSVVRTEVDGFVVNVYVRAGESVAVGQPLVLLDNQQLRADLAIARSELMIAHVKRRMAESRDPASARAEADRIEALQQRIENLSEQVEALVVRSQADGVIITHHLDVLEGRFLAKGNEVLTVYAPGNLIVVAAISQKDVYEYRQLVGSRVEIKLDNSPLKILKGHIAKVHPRTTRSPRHAALTLAAGGPLFLDPSATSESPMVLDPHFTVEVTLDETPALNLLPGSAGQWCVAAHQRPLLQQWYRSLVRRIQARFLF